MGLCGPMFRPIDSFVSTRTHGSFAGIPPNRARARNHNYLASIRSLMLKIALFRPRMSTKELAAVRQERLRGLLRERHVVRVEALAETLEVSPATVRRDLAVMEAEGDLRRVHGGAVANAAERVADEPLFDDKATRAATQKRRIAAAAAALLPAAHTTLSLDGGSTVLAFLAGLLVGQTQHTVVTNSLRVAHILAAGGCRKPLLAPSPAISSKPSRSTLLLWARWD